jgi:mono/diheme cytochrome c family protein
MFAQRTLLIGVVALAALSGLLGTAWASGLFGALNPPPPGITREVANLQLTLNVEPVPAGSWQVELHARDGWGRPVSIEAARARFSMPLICSDQIEVPLAEIAPGHFRGGGAQFTMSGDWSAAVTVEQEGTPIDTGFSVPVRVDEERRLQALAPAPSDERIAAGRLLYAANCVSCHGEAGRGDGPQASGLNPPPANLTQHLVDNKHSDAQVFLMVSRGVSGTAMRGFGTQLTADEIWQLVAYLRTLSPRPEPTPAPRGPILSDS